MYRLLSFVGGGRLEERLGFSLACLMREGSGRKHVGLGILTSLIALGTWVACGF